MKRLMSMVIAACAFAASAQQASLSDARAKIGEAIDSPAALTATIKQLSAVDQKQYLADVNAAIANMPGSAEEKAAKSLDANRAALKGAQKGTVADLLSEVFATASLESLTVINESLASDMFNRASDPSVTYTDEQYVKLAKDEVSKIAARNEKVDDGAVRTGFAILTFVRGSNGTPTNLVATLTELLPEDSREVAQKEWFPSALAQGEEKSYDPMLGTTDAALPNERVVMRLSAARTLDVLLADLAAGDVSATGLENLKLISSTPFGTDRGGIGAGLDSGIHRAPFERPERSRRIPSRPPEPPPYGGQTFRSAR